MAIDINLNEDNNNLKKLTPIILKTNKKDKNNNQHFPIPTITTIRMNNNNRKR